MRVGSSETSASKVLSTWASFPYPVSMTQRSTGFGATHRPESSLSRLQSRVVYRPRGLPASTWAVTRVLTELFQGTKTRALRGFCPLNSHRWRGASRRPNGTGVNCTPGVRRGAGQPVVQADGRMLASHAACAGDQAPQLNSLLVRHGQV